MKKLLILLCLPFIGFGQLTYVPDDVFEEYIETSFPLADNGIVNDDSVLTTGLIEGAQMLLMAPFLNGTITDLTGIEACAPSLLWIDNQLISELDISSMVLSSPILGAMNGLRIENCPILETIYLPLDTFTLTVANNTYLEDIYFNNSIYIVGASESSIGIYIKDNPSLLSLELASILGVAGGVSLMIINNTNLGELNINNGFCYNWNSCLFGANPNLFCIQVDDPNYSSISSNWSWSEFDWQNQNNLYSYSTNCGWSTYVDELTSNKELLKVTDLLGRETKGKKNEPLLYLFDDGTVEKRIVVE